MTRTHVSIVKTERLCPTQVGQFLMNPFGEDDDDFELNYVLDRNTYIAHMMASELADQLPSQNEHRMDPHLPHTRASFRIQDIIPKSHLAAFRMNRNDMQLIRPEVCRGKSSILL